jgi:phosphotransferase system  glucose/maltose/N-acetylglucosamine-specific IIC component
MPARAVVVFAGMFIVLGCGLAVQTARVGGGIGYLLAALFVALGAGRLYLLWARRERG